MQSDWKSLGERYLATNYFVPRLTCVQAKGARVWDHHGREYMDFSAGISVCNLGHCAEDLVQVLTQQANTLWHCSNYYYNVPALELAQKLVERCQPCERVFLCNSGSEANEAAFKAARAYAQYNLPSEQRRIVSLVNSFHGRTLATTAATGQPSYRKDFEPLPPQFETIQAGSIEALHEAVNEQCCAVIVEPVQGEGGVVPLDESYLLTLQQRCHQVGAVFMLDEIQCGLGRCGTLFAHEYIPALRPDIVTLAKGLANGMPIGATLLGDRVARVFKPGSHGSTFGGNPLSCSVAKAVLERCSEPEFLAEVRAKGSYLAAQISHIMKAHITEVRGRGLMLGACLNPEMQGRSQRIVDACMDEGLLVLRAGADVVRFLPPLTLTEPEMAEGLTRLSRAIAAL